MLFPDLSNQRSAVVDLNKEAQRWLAQQPAKSTNPLLDPATCQTFINDVHQRLNVDFSYGGWMEDRSTLWRGSYLDNDQRYIHLGVDFNVPAGTRVAIDRACTVLRIDNDYPDKYGWGTRVILQEPGAEAVLLFAHLDQKLNITIGDQLKAGIIFAKVGQPPYTGDWFPHLHVQMITADHYQKLLADDLRDLDGYAKNENMSELQQIFPNPVTVLRI